MSNTSISVRTDSELKAKANTLKLGGWEGKITVADDFDQPLDDLNEYMQ